MKSIKTIVLLILLWIMTPTALAAPNYNNSSTTAATYQNTWNQYAQQTNVMNQYQQVSSTYALQTANSSESQTSESSEYQSPAKALKKNVRVDGPTLKTSKDGKTNTYVQPFQNITTSLSGLNVRATMYFTKVDYWKLKGATFNLNYEVSQLSDNDQSDITVSVNGVKFYSFRPAKNKGRQTIQITIPTDLIQTTNTLTIDGQIVSKGKNGEYDTVQTPANWLTVYDGSNVNFTFDIIPPTDYIDSFYNHFIGVDTLGNRKNAILVSPQASANELASATYALAGICRVITNNNTTMPLGSFNNKEYMKRPYQLIIARYHHLPKHYQRLIKKEDVDGKAYLRYFNSKNKHVLVVTATSDELLKKGCRYVANQELMTQTKKREKSVYDSTSTFTSTLQFNGNYPLETKSQNLVGPNHQEQVYFVKLPSDQNNADGSYVNLNFRYSKNLDFNSSLMTIYVNDTPIGSKKLTKEKADSDSFRVMIPKEMQLGHGFVIKVAFDLNMKNINKENMQTPWAYIENNSNAFIKTKESPAVLFSNYPSVFITQRSFNNIGVQLPNKMTEEYLQTLSNTFNLLGHYSESNVGVIDFYFDKMTKNQLMSHNVIVIGTPEDNPLIREYNDQFYFRYNQSFTTFKSNEKLSIESDYGKTLGTAQLLFNPFDNERIMMVLTGVTPTQVLLASTQIATRAVCDTYKGDLIAIDNDGKTYNYRFKKKSSYKDKISIVKQINDDPNLKWYLGIGFSVFILLVIALVFFIRKYQVRH